VDGAVSVSAVVRARDEVAGIGAHRSALTARLDPRRAAMVAGKWVALR
jgi:hypothetical protein